MPVISEPALTVTELAKRLPFSEVTLRRMVRRGEIPARRLGRRIFFFPDEVEAALGPIFARPE